MVTNYALRGGAEGKRRLDLLAQVMAPGTRSLLTDAGLRAGMRCADVGCGGGHVSLHLAERVGAAGRVIGLDLDAVKLAAAREASAQRGFGNTEFRAIDIGAWHEPATYDLVYGRFILSHLANRTAVLERMVEALRSDGVLVVEDIDFGGAFCHPPHPAFARYCALYRAVVARRGGDADLGPKLLEMCHRAGLADVHIRVVQPIHHGDAPGKTMALGTLANIREAVLAEGLATAAEFESTLAALSAYTEDPGSIIGQPRVFQAWGRRAAPQAV